jgi:uncharacterized membrane protein HdeD (DUF308 family)
MVRYSLLLKNNDLLEKFSKSSKIFGVIFLLLGLVGILFPYIMSLTTAMVYAWLLIFSAFTIGFHTWQTNSKDWLGWLKTIIFLLIGILMALNPLTAVSALGILFSIYFFMDSFASTALAFELKPKKMWWMSLLNGILSFVIGIYFIVGWPISSMFMVGFLVGISLFFDGIVLLSLGSAAKNLKKES